MKVSVKLVGAVCLTGFSWFAGWQQTPTAGAGQPIIVNRPAAASAPAVANNPAPVESFGYVAVDELILPDEQLPVAATKAAVVLQTTKSSSLPTGSAAVFYEVPPALVAAEEKQPISRSAPVAAAPAKKARADEPVFTVVPTKLAEPVVKNATPVLQKQATQPVARTKVLTGKVERWRTSYRLRYLSFDFEDPHGGVVVLEGNLVQGLQEGCEARAEGQLVDDGHSQAILRVQAIEVLSK